MAIQTNVHRTYWRVIFKLLLFLRRDTPNLLKGPLSCASLSPSALESWVPILLFHWHCSPQCSPPLQLARSIRAGVISFPLISDLHITKSNHTSDHFPLLPQDTLKSQPGFAKPPHSGPSLPPHVPLLFPWLLLSSHTGFHTIPHTTLPFPTSGLLSTVVLHLECPSPHPNSVTVVPHSGGVKS